MNDCNVEEYLSSLSKLYRALFGTHVQAFLSLATILIKLLVGSMMDYIPQTLLSFQRVIVKGFWRFELEILQRYIGLKHIFQEIFAQILVEMINRHFDKFNGLPVQILHRVCLNFVEKN